MTDKLNTVNESDLNYCYHLTIPGMELDLTPVLCTLLIIRGVTLLAVRSLLPYPGNINQYCLCISGFSYLAKTKYMTPVEC